MEYSKDISIIVPLLNEKESLPELVAWIRRVVEKEGWTYEIIMIDDGSTDGSWDTIKELSASDSSIHGIRFRRNYGKSAALFHGFKAAEGRVVFTMDADLQDSPDELPEMYRMVTEEDWDVVSGWKQHRQDNKLTKNLPSKLYNATARWITGIRLHDMNCGLKAYKNEVVKNIEVYGEMHRYIPYLAKNAGFDKIGEKVVHHQARKYGKSKFGLNRFFNGYLDLLTLWFLSNFGKKPMHVFGFLGSLVFFISFIALAILGISKLVELSQGNYGHLVTDSAWFYIFLTSMLIGTQLFLAGFIGDLVSRSNPNRNDYQIEEEIRCGK